MVKGSGKRLSDDDKIKIIRLMESPHPPKMRKLARDYGVNDKSIRNIVKNKDTIKSRIENTSGSTHCTRFREPNAKFPELEKILVSWLEAARRMNLPMPPAMMKVKATDVASTLQLSTDDFKASDGWLRRFRDRNGIGSLNLYGEGGEVDRNHPDMLLKLSQLEQLIDQYDEDNVYNMDETGLFFRLIPRYTLLLPHEDIQTARGKKTQKERVTLTVCCNATGSHKVPLHMIGKPAKPACMVNREWPLCYHHQKKVKIAVPVTDANIMSELRFLLGMDGSPCLHAMVQ